MAVRQFVAERDDGQTVVVPQGAVFKTTDPIVKAHSSMFTTTKRGKASR